MAFRIEPIRNLPTLRVLVGNETVGFLYDPGEADGEWELWPRMSRTDAFPDGDKGAEARRFASRHEAMAFLGLPERARA